MRIEKAAARIFQMTDAVWEVHANPWSVWTRFSCLPLLIVAIWSRIWLDYYSLVPIAVVCLWIWLNPRLFKKPRTTNHWASKAVLGERLLLDPERPELPAHHEQALVPLKLIAFTGFLLVVYGLVVLQAWPTITGTIVTILGKTWFLDRMVWIYQDLAPSKKEYQDWLY